MRCYHYHPVLQMGKLRPRQVNWCPPPRWHSCWKGQGRAGVLTEAEAGHDDAGHRHPAEEPEGAVGGEAGRAGGAQAHSDHLHCRALQHPLAPVPATETELPG